MKRLFCMIALAAISFGSVYAHSSTRVKASTQVDTTKKKKAKKDSTKKKKDTLQVKKSAG
ncbi:MAG TPA: hypothetical protein VFE53_09555 [Mucilaginibacter sp.]|nr:hypothetical protein [Mucilaginibacter sp.]